MDDLEKYIIEDKDYRFLPPSVYVTEKNGYMSQAVNELYSKQIQLTQMYGIVKEDNPAIIELKESIRRTKQDLLQYISSTRKAANEQIQNIESEISSYLSQVKTIPEKQRDVLNIQRKFLGESN